MSIKHILKRNSILLFCLLILGGVLASARAQEAILKGIVKDAQGNPLDKVKVILLDPESGTKLTARSNKKGEFIKVGIPPASYEISFCLDGYFTSYAQVAFGIATEKIVTITLYKIPPKLDQDEDFKKGLEYFNQQKFKEAVAAFKKVTEKFPESYEALYNLALGYFRSGDFHTAICFLKNLIELKPGVEDAYFALGECYFQKGDTEKALELFIKITELFPTSARGYYNLGLSYLKLDKTEEALWSFEKVLEIDPKNSSAFYQAAIASLRKADYQKALKYLETFLSLEPNAPEVDTVKAIIEELKKQI